MRRFVIGLSLLVIGLICCEATLAQEPSKGLLALSLPDLSWSLEIAEPGFTVEQREIAPSGNAARLMAANKGTGIIVSATMERAPKAGGSKECRQYYWSRAKGGPLTKGRIKMYESGPFAIVEYIIPEYLGVKVNQKNINAYLAEGDYWIDVHLSKADYGAEGDDVLLPILKSIRINKSFTPSSLDHFRYGSLYYRDKDYRRAALQYEKALEMEKQKASLDRTMLKVLIDQLGMSYGISGKLDKAVQVFEWAITQEPEYPMFHYNLACAFAEMGNRDEALKYLHLAYKYKGNMLAGESFPNPKEDASFSKYLKDKEFSAELESMN
jgi:tetratricopeptide (TPR) repeat protein